MWHLWASMNHVDKGQQTINCRGRILDLTLPRVMAIVNVNSDSFFVGSRAQSEDEFLSMVNRHIQDGASIIDIGAMSTRPGAIEISLEKESEMILWATDRMRQEFPEALVSVDTYRASIARQALDLGAHIINDIGGGRFDPAILQVVADAGAPYVLMHNRVRSADMTSHTAYKDLIREMLSYFYHQTWKAKKLGIVDIIIDPGLGFSKTSMQNFIILNRLQEFDILGKILLIGLSRKSMIYKTLNTVPAAALNGTSAMHMIALQHGAKILRVHDTKEAMECIQLYNQLKYAESKKA